MIGVVLRIRRQFQKFLVRHAICLNFCDSKGAFCQSASLIEYYCFRVGQRL